MLKLDDDINEFVANDILNIIIQNMQINYKKYQRKAKLSKDFWPALMSDEKLLLNLEKAIVAKRKLYHHEYSVIRNENKKRLTQDVLTASYGEKLQWNYPYKDAPIHSLSSIMEVKKLKLGFLQNLAMTTADAINYVARGIFKNEEYIDRNEWRKEFLATNFKEACENAIKADIRDWITRDSKQFVETSKKSFDELMTVIEEGLDNCITNCNAKEAERDARQKNLEHYRHEIDKTVENLGELTKEIRKLNP